MEKKNPKIIFLIKTNEFFGKKILWRIFSCFYCKLEKKKKKNVQNFRNYKLKGGGKKKTWSPNLATYHLIGKRKKPQYFTRKLKHITAPPLLPLQQTTKQNPKTDLNKEIKKKGRGKRGRIDNANATGGSRRRCWMEGRTDGRTDRWAGPGFRWRLGLAMREATTDGGGFVSLPTGSTNSAAAGRLPMCLRRAIIDESVRREKRVS